MPLPFYPQMGTIVICDFKGFMEPEMTKRRPVIVVSPKRKNSPRLCTVVPLSTTAPRPVESHHVRLDFGDDPLPAPYDSSVCWAKCDMIYQVSLDRLTLPFDGKDPSGKRVYDQRIATAETLSDIRNCIARALSIPV